MFSLFKKKSIDSFTLKMRGTALDFYVMILNNRALSSYLQRIFNETRIRTFYVDTSSEIIAMLEKSVVVFEEQLNCKVVFYNKSITIESNLKETEDPYYVFSGIDRRVLVKYEDRRDLSDSLLTVLLDNDKEDSTSKIELEVSNCSFTKIKNLKHFVVKNELCSLSEFSIVEDILNRMLILKYKQEDNFSLVIGSNDKIKVLLK